MEYLKLVQSNILCSRENECVVHKRVVFIAFGHKWKV